MEWVIEAHLKEARDALRNLQDTRLAFWGKDEYTNREDYLVDRIHKLDGSHEERMKARIRSGWAFIARMGTRKKKKKRKK